MGQTEDRRSFRRILISRLGFTLAVALALICVALWLVAVLWTNYQALVPLRAESAHVAEVTSAGGVLRPEQYDWSEPHHRYASERIDPFFLQVFDADGQLIRTSENVGALAAAYPIRLLGPLETSASRPLRFSVGEDRLYAYVRPIRGPSGALLGAVQVARFDLGQEAALQQLALGLGGGYVVVLGLLLGMLIVTSRRVIKPLETLTADAAQISAHAARRQVPVPAGADRETAELARTINKSLEGIDAAFEEVRRFTADAAHELQTPLAILTGHIDVTLRRERDGAEYRETLMTLKDEVDSMTALVRALLELAHLDIQSDANGNPVFRDEEFDLNEIVASEVHELRQKTAGTPLEVKLSAKGNALVAGHPKLIREAVFNLLDNAHKYTDRGLVRVTTEQTDGSVSVSVTDTGRGIRTEDLPRVTERFFRARDVHELPGNGLGLTLVEAIARRHGGSLEVSPADGGGTCARLTLPSA